MRKKLVAAALCAALALSPAAAVFPDVTDPQVSEAVEILGQLKVVNGRPDGTFDPGGRFTRAEFCKMALTALDRAEEAQLHQNQVIFPDVTAVHWALGYVNAAAIVREGSTPLVQGRGDGSFGPDLAITAGEAVTILMRSLGYSDADVGGTGGVWYAGHMAKARAIGLLDGLEDLAGDGSLTRGQAALLFENLLYTPVKGSESLFLEGTLGGSVGESQLVLEVMGKALAGGGWSVKTNKGSFVTFRGRMDSALRGRRCKPVLDRDGNLLALRPDEDYTTRTVRIAAAEARYVRTESGEQLLVPGATPVWRADQSEQTYSSAYKEIVPGTTALFCYDKTDTLASIYLTLDSATAITAVAGEGARPFEGAWSEQPTAVYKNGVPASLADVKPYDVGTFDPRTGVLEVSDRKLTGMFEDAKPSPASPDSVTVMGCGGLEVLDCALESLTGFRLGDQVTLLLDGHNRVAGAVSPAQVSSKVLGLATVTKGEPDENGRDTYSAKVATATGLTLSGRVRISAETVQTASSRLWAVTSSRVGWLELTTPVPDRLAGDWDVAGKRLGSVPVSPRAAVYDKIEGGAITEVGLEAVTMPAVPAGKIAFLHLDSAGAVDVLVLDNVTGDGYTYGRITHVGGRTAYGEYVNAVTTVTNAAGSLEMPSNDSYGKFKNSYLGLAPTTVATGMVRIAGSMPLTAYPGVSRASFRTDSVTIDGVVWPLCGSIDKQCYNPVSETWFDSLDAALAYAPTLTVYCDRSPQEGGKVRLVTPDP